VVSLHSKEECLTFVENTVNSQSGSPFTTYILFSFGYLVTSPYSPSNEVDRSCSCSPIISVTSRTKHHRPINLRHSPNLHLHNLDLSVLQTRSLQHSPCYRHRRFPVNWFRGLQFRLCHHCPFFHKRTESQCEYSQSHLVPHHLLYAFVHFAGKFGGR
jgi:hypothetical protein